MLKDQSTKSFMELYMINSIECLPDRSYTARFPWNQSQPSLPTNFLTCAHRTISLAHNLAETPPLLSKFNEILADQQHRGFIQQVHPPDNCTRYHFIAHLLSGKTAHQLPFALFMTAAAINQETKQV